MFSGRELPSFIAYDHSIASPSLHPKFLNSPGEFTNFVVLPSGAVSFAVMCEFEGNGCKQKECGYESSSISWNR